MHHPLNDGVRVSAVDRAAYVGRVPNPKNRPSELKGKCDF